MEKPIIIEKFVEKPIETIIDQPVDVIIEEEVFVDRIVDKEIRRTILKPKRTEIQTNEIIQEVIVPEDVIIEKRVEKVYNKYVEVPITKTVEKEYIKEVEV